VVHFSSFAGLGTSEMSIRYGSETLRGRHFYDIRSLAQARKVTTVMLTITTEDNIFGTVGFTEVDPMTYSNTLLQDKQTSVALLLSPSEANERGLWSFLVNRLKQENCLNNEPPPYR